MEAIGFFVFYLVLEFVQMTFSDGVNLSVSVKHRVSRNLVGGFVGTLGGNVHQNLPFEFRSLKIQ